jgi:hypothetical protein
MYLLGVQEVVVLLLKVGPTVLQVAAAVFQADPHQYLLQQR